MRSHQNASFEEGEISEGYAPRSTKGQHDLDQRRDFKQISQGERAVEYSHPPPLRASSSWSGAPVSRGNNSSKSPRPSYAPDDLEMCGKFSEHYYPPPPPPPHMRGGEWADYGNYDYELAYRDRAYYPDRSYHYDYPQDVLPPDHNYDLRFGDSLNPPLEKYDFYERRPSSVPSSFDIAPRHAGVTEIPYPRFSYSEDKYRRDGYGRPADAVYGNNMSNNRQSFAPPPPPPPPPPPRPRSISPDRDRMAGGGSRSPYFAEFPQDPTQRKLSSDPMDSYGNRRYALPVQSKRNPDKLTQGSVENAKRLNPFPDGPAPQKFKKDNNEVMVAGDIKMDKGTSSKGSVESRHDVVENRIELLEEEVEHKAEKVVISATVLEDAEREAEKPRVPVRTPKESVDVTAVHFILPTATKLTETESSIPKFLKAEFHSNEKSQPISLPTDLRSLSSALHTAIPDDNTRKPRAAWGKGLVKSVKASEEIKSFSDMDHEEEPRNCLGKAVGVEELPTTQEVNDLAAEVPRGIMATSDVNESEVGVSNEMVAPDVNEWDAEVPKEIVVPVVPQGESAFDICGVSSSPPDSTILSSSSAVHTDEYQNSLLDISVIEKSANDSAREVSEEIIDMNECVLPPLAESDEVQPTSSEHISSKDNDDADATPSIILQNSDLSLSPDNQSSSSTNLPKSRFNARGGRGNGRGSVVDQAKSAPFDSSYARQGQDSHQRTPWKEKRAGKDETRLGSIFSSESDIHRAYNAIVYMLELQKSNADAISQQQAMYLSRLLQDVKTVTAAAKISMPRTKEICDSIDLLNQTAENYYAVLKSYREKKYLMELTLKELTPESAAQIDGTLSSNVSSPLCADVHHHNKLRVIEAHFFTTIVRHSQINEGQFNSNSLTNSSFDRYEHSMGEIGNTTMCLQGHTSAGELAKKRPVMSKHIRNLKLTKSKAWRTLGQKYTDVFSKWNAHVEDLEKRDSNNREGPKLRNAALSYGSFARSVPPETTSSRTNSTLNSSGGAEISTWNQMAVRSDYEQERLINELCAKELVFSKISKGVAPIPSMHSPWLQADTTIPIKKPHWSQKLRNIVFAPDATKSSCVGEVDHDHYEKILCCLSLPSNAVDCDGVQNTTDGKKQNCISLLPTQQCPINCNCALQVEKLGNFNRIWSDVEKCIFVDKFLQFPKNFHRIASFLPNRTTKDCVKFYYDAKYTVEFKQLLKEHDNRRKQVKANWLYSTKAAHVSGGELFPPNNNEVKDFLVQAPMDDSSYSTFIYTPSFISRLCSFPLPISSHKMALENEEGKRQLIQVYPHSELLSRYLRYKLFNIHQYLDDNPQVSHQITGVNAKSSRKISDDEEDEDEAQFADLEDVVRTFQRLGNLTMENSHIHEKDPDMSLINGTKLPAEPFNNEFVYSFNENHVADFMLPLYSFSAYDTSSYCRAYYSELAQEHLPPESYDDRLNCEVLNERVDLSMNFDDSNKGQFNRQHPFPSGRGSSGRRGCGRGKNKGVELILKGQRTIEEVPSAAFTPNREPTAGRGRGRGRGRQSNLFDAKIAAEKEKSRGRKPSTTNELSQPSGAFGRLGITSCDIFDSSRIVKGDGKNEEPQVDNLNDSIGRYSNGDKQTSLQPDASPAEPERQ